MCTQGRVQYLSHRVHRLIHNRCMAQTRAIQVLENAGVEFYVHPYEITEHVGSYGEDVAAALGLAPEQLFKTLVAEVDGVACIAIVPTNSKLSLKALARAVGGKRSEMANAADAERLTGYVTGGISPFGQKRRLQVVTDSSITNFDTVFVSGGRRGLQLELQPADLIRLLGATVADLAE